MDFSKYKNKKTRLSEHLENILIDTIVSTLSDKITVFLNVLNDNYTYHIDQINCFLVNPISINENVYSTEFLAFALYLVTLALRRTKENMQTIVSKLITTSTQYEKNNEIILRRINFYHSQTPKNCGIHFFGLPHDSEKKDNSTLNPLSLDCQIITDIVIRDSLYEKFIDLDDMDRADDFYASLFRDFTLNLYISILNETSDFINDILPDIDNFCNDMQYTKY